MLLTFMTQSRNRALQKVFYQAIVWALIFSFAATGAVLAAPPQSPSDTDEQNRRARQEAEARQQREQQRDVFLQKGAKATADTSLPEESPSFEITTLRIEGEKAAQFPWLGRMLDKYKGKRIGMKGINLIVKRLTNQLIDRGYVTTRILVPEQDVSKGTLRLILVAGTIRSIRFQDPNTRGNWRTAFPARPGDILNLRALEQGLEQMKRVPSQDVDMKLMPGDKPGESDVVITVKKATR